MAVGKWVSFVDLLNFAVESVKKGAGIKLGRPFGSKSKHKKLSGKENLILKMRNEGISLRKMAKILKVSVNTLSVFIKENGL